MAKPVRQMQATSPWATPLSMMSLIRTGMIISKVHSIITSSMPRAISLRYGPM